MGTVPEKLREPSTIVLLVVVALQLVLAVVELVRSISDLSRYGRSALPAGDVLNGAAGVASFSGVDALNVVALALLVGACALWSPTRHARRLTLAALLVTGCLLVVSVADLVVLARAARPASIRWTEVLHAFFALPLPVLVLVALAQLRRSFGVGARSSRPEIAVAAAAEETTPALEVRQPEPDPEDQPVWQPDQASGAAWLTAGDAAAGAAASRWGTPGDAGGWQPQSRGQAAPGPDTTEDPDRPPRA